MSLRNLSRRSLRDDKHDGGKTHIGYIADEVLKAIPKEIEHVVSKDREYLGLNYLVLSVLVHKAVQIK